MNQAIQTLKNQAQQIQLAKMQIEKSVVNMASANALISKWSHKDLGPNPLQDAIQLEAKNQVFGWGK